MFFFLRTVNLSVFLFLLIWHWLIFSWSIICFLSTVDLDSLIPWLRLKHLSHLEQEIGLHYQMHKKTRMIEIPWKIIISCMLIVGEPILLNPHECLISERGHITVQWRHPFMKILKIFIPEIFPLHKRREPNCIAVRHLLTLQSAHFIKPIQSPVVDWWSQLWTIKLKIKK